MSDQQQDLALAAAAGLDTSTPEAQAKDAQYPTHQAQSAEVESLRSRITELEAKLESNRVEPAKSDEQQMGEAILRGIEAARSPWFSYGAVPMPRSNHEQLNKLRQRVI